jgi:hypothetical protein
MRIRSFLTLALLPVLAACGGDASTGSTATAAPADDPGAAQAGAADIDCPPLEVAIDGTPVPGLDHAYAFSDPSTGGYGVQVFNHEATCAEVLAGSRDVPPDEVEVRAFIEEGATRGAVGVGSKTNYVQGIELVRKPAKEGDLTAICVSDAKWTAGFGGGTTYEIRGLFSASYCGER